MKYCPKSNTKKASNKERRLAEQAVERGVEVNTDFDDEERLKEYTEKYFLGERQLTNVDEKKGRE